MPPVLPRSCEFPNDIIRGALHKDDLTNPCPKVSKLDDALQGHAFGSVDFGIPKIICKTFVGHKKI
jgi:hypothetical protein